MAKERELKSDIEKLVQLIELQSRAIRSLRGRNSIDDPLAVQIATCKDSARRIAEKWKVRNNL